MLLDIYKNLFTVTLMNPKNTKVIRKKIYVLNRYSREEGVTETVAYFLSFRSASNRWDKLAKKGIESSDNTSIETPRFIYEFSEVNAIA